MRLPRFTQHVTHQMIRIAENKEVVMMFGKRIEILKIDMCIH